MPQKIAALQRRLGYEFRSTALLLEALTHPSYLQDHPQAGPHNQRLEFLGDSVIQFILTDALFREFAAEREGVLSRRRAVLSNGGFLTLMARDLGLDAALRLSKSESDSGGRTRASTLEMPSRLSLARSISTVIWPLSASACSPGMARSLAGLPSWRTPRTRRAGCRSFSNRSTATPPCATR